MPLLFDGHLDLAWNATAFGRDQTLPLEQLRQRERDLPRDGREPPMVSLPQLRRAGVAVFLGTLFARAQPATAPGRMLLRADTDFPSQALAHAAAVAQLGYYQLLARRGELRLIDEAAGLEQHWAAWHDGTCHSLGCILMIEGADPVTEPDEIRWWHRQGVRALSLSHAGISAYAAGNGAPADAGGLTEPGRALLAHMAELGMALDLSHLSDAGFAEAIERYDGPVFASHSNCRQLVPGDRQLGDGQLRIIGQRGGVIGVALHNAMLSRHWQGGPGRRQGVSLRAAAEHIDHICQRLGDARHAAIGSDLDGGFGLDSCPHELDSIADLPRLAEHLSARGFRDGDIAAVFHGNWLGFWRRVLAPPSPTEPCEEADL